MTNAPLTYRYEQSDYAGEDPNDTRRVDVAGADEKQAAVMEQCGTDIGLAFQIQDDILDVIGDQEKLGKPVHSDEKNEKTTAVSVYGIDVCRQKVKDYTDRGIEALEALDIPGKEHQEFLVELMKSLVGREM